MEKSKKKIDKELLKKLDTVIDPELGIPITDMGLIYGIEKQDSLIHVTMTLTTIGCPLYDVIHDDIVKTIQRSQEAACTRSAQSSQCNAVNQSYGCHVDRYSVDVPTTLNLP